MLVSFPPLSPLPRHCCRKWLTLLYHGLTKKNNPKKPTDFPRNTRTHTLWHKHALVSMGRTCAWLESVSNFLITRRLQSKQLNTAQADSLLTQQFLPLFKTAARECLFSNLGENFENSPQYFFFSLPSLQSFSLLRFPLALAFACTQFCRQPTPLSSKLYANPCLDWRLTGFFAAPNTHDLIRNAGILAVKSLISNSGLGW